MSAMTMTTGKGAGGRNPAARPGALMMSTKAADHSLAAARRSGVLMTMMKAEGGLETPRVTPRQHDGAGMNGKVPLDRVVDRRMMMIEDPPGVAGPTMIAGPTAAAGKTMIDVTPGAAVTTTMMIGGHHVIAAGAGGSVTQRAIPKLRAGGGRSGKVHPDRV